MPGLKHLKILSLFLMVGEMINIYKDLIVRNIEIALLYKRMGQIFVCKLLFVKDAFCNLFVQFVL